MGKIISISESVAQPATIRDGNYTGTWSGYIIIVKAYDKTYELKTDVGIKTMAGVPVVVTIQYGIATYKEVNN